MSRSEVKKCPKCARAFCVADLHWLGLLPFCWAWVRVFEVFVYQTNVLLFDKYRAKKAGKDQRIESFLRLVVLLLMNYVEVIFWFAIIYFNLEWFSLVPSGIHLNSFFESINFSFVTMTTFGYTTVVPEHVMETIITLIQSAVGLFMALLVLAPFVSLLLEPKDLERSEKMVQQSKATFEQSTAQAEGIGHDMEEPKHGNLAPFLLSIYGCSGLIIVLLRNGTWNEFSGQGLGIVESLQHGAFFIVLLFLLLFLNVYLSMKLSNRYNMSDVIFGSVSLFLFLTLTEVVLRPPVSQDISWTTILFGVLPGGIIGWSHALFIGFAKLRQEWSVKANNLERNNWEGKKIFSRALELEHSSLQTTLNWILWASLVFLTAGLTAYFIQQIDDPNLGFRVTISMPMVIWGVFGICFGVVVPIVNTMKYVRQELVRLSTSDTR